MPELRDVAGMIEAAERAAVADDLASADELLKGAARIQETELGPLHPDLANTLNNLAIVAEKTGRFDEAETFYRRAVAITSASLPLDHPMAAASRENLEAFCRARGLPIDTPVLVDAPPLPSDSPPSVPRERTLPAPEPLPPAPRKASRSIAWTAISVLVVLMTVTLLVRRPWSSREPSPPAPAAEPAPPQAVERTPPPRTEPPALPAPTEPSEPPAVVSGSHMQVTAQLCRTFSTSGASWRCDPVGDPVSPGAIVFYSRVKSSRDAVVVHRWYRGDTLRQSVSLKIRANSTEGYCTYSRQTVDGPADWRVEVRSATDDLLHEQRFAVR